MSGTQSQATSSGHHWSATWHKYLPQCSWAHVSAHTGDIDKRRSVMPGARGGVGRRLCGLADVQQAKAVLISGSWGWPGFEENNGGARVVGVPSPPQGISDAPVVVWLHRYHHKSLATNLQPPTLRPCFPNVRYLPETPQPEEAKVQAGEGDAYTK